jgi:hypothetical protein
MRQARALRALTPFSVFSVKCFTFDYSCCGYKANPRDYESCASAFNVNLTFTIRRRVVYATRPRP